MYTQLDSYWPIHEHIKVFHKYLLQQIHISNREHGHVSIVVPANNTNVTLKKYLVVLT